MVGPFGRLLALCFDRVMVALVRYKEKNGLKIAANLFKKPINHAKMTCIFIELI